MNVELYILLGVVFACTCGRGNVWVNAISEKGLLNVCMLRLAPKVSKSDKTPR